MQLLEIAVPKPLALPKFVDAFSGRVLVAVAAATIGYLAGAISPFWPTAPEIEAGAPSSASPFDIPFTITNKSKFFKINNLRISCEIIEALTATNSGLVGVGLIVDASNYIMPTEAPIYTCPLNRFVKLPGPVARASIRFSYSYSQSFLWSETGMSPKQTKEFRLLTNVSPQRWTSERSLN